MANGQIGKTSCSDTMTCFVGCPKEGSFGCQSECYAGGDAQSQKGIQTLYACLLSAAKAGKDGGTCVYGALDCSAGSGSASCKVTSECMDACGKTQGGDQAHFQCMIDCVSAASPAAWANYKKFLDCMVGQCNGCKDSECLVCMGQKCGTEYTTCVPPG